MLAVPRAREKFEGISVNALGFAGSLFVRDEAEAARVRATGPMVLAAVAGFPVG
jgi:ATP adenylyltransferase